MNIRDKLSLIQSKFKAKKSRFNNFGKYNFRSAEDILEALKPYNIEHNVYFTVDETWLGDGVMQSSATIVCNESGENVVASAIVGVDYDQKGMQMPQKFGSASSYGKKYALGNLLLIDDTADADATNSHGKGAIHKTIPGTNKQPNVKPVINMDNIDKAKKFLSNGGLLSTLQQKYIIEADALKQLQNG
jgi:hypothetical protein